MDWPTLQYMKANPDRVLLETSKFTTLQMGAWSRIWFEMVKLPLPGVMAWTDLTKLHEWTGLSLVMWEKVQVRVLGKFRFHPATGSLHDAMIRDVYLDFTRQTLRMRAGGKASAARRNERKIGHSVSDRGSDLSPYSKYCGDFVEISDSNWQEICKIIEKTRPIPSTLQGTSKVLQSTLSTTTITTSNGGGTTPALLSGEGAGVDRQTIAVFLAAHTDVQLADIQRQWLTHDTTPSKEFFSELYRGKNPRVNPGLAEKLYAFNQTYPAPSAIPTTETPPAIAGESA